MSAILYAVMRRPGGNISRHQHTDWELDYCVSGSAEYHFEDRSITVSPGEFLVIPPGAFHTITVNRGLVDAVVSLRRDMLPLFEPELIRDDQDRLIYQAFVAACFHYSRALETDGPLLDACGDLLAAYVVAARNNRCSTLVRQIESSIIRNYADCDYELDKFLRSLPYSYDYLRKLFKKEMGVTPHQYLSDIRLRVAASWIRTLGYSERIVSEVAVNCGFKEPLYFSRIFKKKYGVAPSQYGADAGTYAEQAAF